MIRLTYDHHPISNQFNKNTQTHTTGPIQRSCFPTGPHHVSIKLKTMKKQDEMLNEFLWTAQRIETENGKLGNLLMNSWL